ncbi:MAG: hydroxyacylglutathione hydrolase [Alphaproteobacteria bacterium]|nr:hydroxyacylglutathione hydrolase [Alphaproteobacteria bacterium]
MPIEIRQFPCLADNYGYLVRDAASGLVAAIDTPDAGAVNAALAREGWRLDFIFNTHWHPDHASGNLALKRKWHCRIIAPEGEADKIPGVDQKTQDGDRLALGETTARVIATPGHTLGHVIYYFESDGAAFVGDTIFALGCGRLFEGTPEQMWRSLSAIAALPAQTKLYCAHEYTEANARFALAIDPANAALQARAAEIGRLRAQGAPTVPTDVAAERAANPFLRAGDPGLQARIGMAGADPVAVFAEIRKRKDRF